MSLLTLLSILLICLFILVRLFILTRLLLITLLPSFFYRFVPWGLIRVVSVFFFYLISLFNVYLLYGFFRRYKYSFVLVPVFYFSIPAVEYATLLLITFLLLAFKFFKSKPYWSAFFLGLSLLTKTYALFIIVLLLVYRLFGDDFLTLSFSRDDLLVVFYQLLIVIVIQLVVYFPFGYGAVFNRLFNVVSHGFNFFDLGFPFLFPMLALLLVTLYSCFRFRSNRLLLLFVFYLLMFVSQSKLGANLYYSILTPFLLFQFFSSDDKRLRLVLFFLVVFFYFAFIGIHANFIIIGPSLERFFLQFRFIPDDTLFFSTNGVNPLLFSKSAFETMIPYSSGLDVQSFDNVFFNIHSPPSGFNSSSYFSSYLSAFSACVFCKDEVLFFTRNSTLWRYFKDYSFDRFSFICDINPTHLPVYNRFYGTGFFCPEGRLYLRRTSRDFYYFSRFFCIIGSLLLLVFYFVFELRSSFQQV